MTITTSITALLIGGFAAIQAIKNYWNGKELLHTDPQNSYKHSKNASMWAITGLLLLWGSLATTDWPEYLFPLLAIIMLIITIRATR